MSEKIILQMKNLVKEYGTGGFTTRVLKGIDLNVYAGDFLAVMGPSGSGKTTLLNILSTIDKPTGGTLYLEGQDMTRLGNRELSRIRRDKIGFIFQEYNLLDTMSLQDNIALPLSLNGMSGEVCLQKTKELARQFGLEEHLSKYPYQLSGGQKQRGAVCRAFITEPSIIFADEPTGALDSKAGRELLQCLKRMNEERGAAILMVTHDAFCASYAKDVYLLGDGLIRCRQSRYGSRKEFYDQIIDMQAALSMGGETI